MDLDQRQWLSRSFAKRSVVSRSRATASSAITAPSTRRIIAISGGLGGSRRPSSIASSRRCHPAAAARISDLFGPVIPVSPYWKRTVWLEPGGGCTLVASRVQRTARRLQRSAATKGPGGPLSRPRAGSQSLAHLHASQGYRGRARPPNVAESSVPRSPTLGAQPGRAPQGSPAEPSRAGPGVERGRGRRECASSHR